MIDIIIPVLNEERILTENAPYYRALKDKTKVIFVDGGSTDRTAEVARSYGEVISSPPGRAIQKNRGAQSSPAEHLLFLNADVFLSDGALDHCGWMLSQGAAAGCLTMRIDDKGTMFRFYEWAVNFRARAFGIIDGDLGMFIRRDVFDRLGGFDPLPVMEDIIFSKKLRKLAKAHVLPDVIRVSSRKWHERGFMRTFWDYTIAYLKFWTGKLDKQIGHTTHDT